MDLDIVLLTRLHVLVFIEHGTRRMRLGGVTADLTGEWTVQRGPPCATQIREPAKINWK